MRATRSASSESSPRSEEGDAPEAAAVRPRLPLHDAAPHVGKHGEDLGEEPRAVGASKLQRRQSLERCRSCWPVPRPKQLPTCSM